MPTAGVYIDGSNIYHGGKQAGWRMNYSALKSFIERKYRISIISYYNSRGYQRDSTGKYMKDSNGVYIPDPGAVRFENGLVGQGFRVVTKPLKFIKGDEHIASNKFDGDLMIDALTELEKWDEMLLFTGDCDFEKLVKHVISVPKHVKIFSYASRMSHELKLLSFQSPYVDYTELDKLKGVLAYGK